MTARRRWFRLRDVERDVDAEIASYVEESVRDLESRGWTAAAARQEAQRRFGDITAYRRELVAIDRSVEARMRRRLRFEALADTLTSAVRGVVRSPALSAGIVLAFALGLGANATMFGAVERLLLRPPPHIVEPDGVRRLLVNREFLGRRHDTETLAYPDFADLTAARSFAQVAAYAPEEVMVGSGSAAAPVRALLVTSAWWELLGVQPAVGRFFGAAEDRFEADGTVVLGWGYWQRRYSGDPGVVGATLDIGHGPYTIIGVAPRGFTGVDLQPVDLFVPLHAAGADTHGGVAWAESRGFYWLRTVGRVVPGVALAVAEAEATALHRVGRADSRSYDPDARIVAAPLLAAQGPNAPSEVAVARWLLAVSAIVLLVACLNVANLLLARLVRQRRELAIRLALGVTRARLIGQIMLEGTLLGLLGGGAALLLSSWGGVLVQRTLLPDIEWSRSPSTTLLLTVLGLAIAAGLLSALLPALQASRRGAFEGLRVGSGVNTRSAARVRTTLSMVQAALSVVLLIGAGLFVRSLDRARHGDFGLDPWPVAQLAPVFHSGSEPGDAEQRDLFVRAAERVAALPGVEAAAVTRGTPFGSSYAYALHVPGFDSIPRRSTGGPYGSLVTPGYFATLGIRVLQGRVFDERDTPGAPPVIVVNETFARAFWEGDDPLTKCVRVGEPSSPCAQVIGVVRDARRNALVEDDTYQYYLPLLQQADTRRAEALLLRVAGDLPPVVAAAEREVLGLDPRIRLVRTRALEEMIAPELRQWRLGAALFSLFGVLTLVVAATGLYSLLAFDVAQRAREIGVRTALGASAPRIVGLVVAHAARVTGAGLLIGVAAALLLAPRLRDMLYGVGPRDPLTYAAAILALLLTATVAAGVPAWRAARVDPAITLRAD